MKLLEALGTPAMTRRVFLQQAAPPTVAGILAMVAGCARRHVAGEGESNAQVALPQESIVAPDQVQQLYEQLAHCEGLVVSRPLLIAKVPGSPTIVLVADLWHGSPEHELSVLQILRERFGIHFVGVEGWAGPEADEHRGRQILNAEVRLIQGLRADVNFTTVGLEDPTLQLVALKIHAVRFYLSSKRAWEQLPERTKKLQEAQRRRDSFRGVADDFVTQTLGLDPTDETYTSLQQDVEAHLGQPLESYYSSEPREIARHPAIRAITVDQRSAAGVGFMLQHMQHHGISTGSMVFGQGHSHSIANHCAERGDAHLITVQWKDPR